MVLHHQYQALYINEKRYAIDGNLYTINGRHYDSMEGDTVRWKAVYRHWKALRFNGNGVASSPDGITPPIKMALRIH